MRKIIITEEQTRTIINELFSEIPNTSQRNNTWISS